MMHAQFKPGGLYVESIPDIDQDEERHQMYRPQAIYLTIYAVFTSLCILRVLSDLLQTLYSAAQLNVHGAD